MKKLFKVKIGKPTGGNSGWISFNYGEEKKIKPEYFVVAKTFNEAGGLVMGYIDSIIAQEQSQIRITETGMESIEQEYNVCQIELVTNELITSN